MGKVCRMHDKVDHAWRGRDSHPGISIPALDSSVARYQRAVSPLSMNQPFRRGTRNFALSSLFRISIAPTRLAVSNNPRTDRRMNEQFRKRTKFRPAWHFDPFVHVQFHDACERCRRESMGNNRFASVTRKRLKIRRFFEASKFPNHNRWYMCSEANVN